MSTRVEVWCVGRDKSVHKRGRKATTLSSRMLVVDQTQSRGVWTNTMLN